MQINLENMKFIDSNNRRLLHEITFPVFFHYDFTTNSTMKLNNHE